MGCLPFSVVSIASPLVRIAYLKIINYILVEVHIHTYHVA